MKQQPFLLHLVAAAVTLAASQASLAQSPAASAGVPVSMVVTVEPHHGAEATSIASENVAVYEGRSRAQVTEWVPLQGDRAGLELFILLDDAAHSSYGTQLEDLRHFILTQPASTKIGVAYMQQGGPKVVQNLTADHTVAANALHVSLGNLANSASPYLALQQLIDQWPATKDRREVLMISNGSDADFGDFGADNPYVDAAIEKAQRANVIVFAISSTGDDIGSNQGTRGRNYLAQLAEETGGESYYYRSSAPTSFAPYLEDSTRQLSRQYLVTFLARPEKRAGMQSVKVRSEAPHEQLVSAERVYVPAAE